MNDLKPRVAPLRLYSSYSLGHLVKYLSDKTRIYTLIGSDKTIIVFYDSFPRGVQTFDGDELSYLYTDIFQEPESERTT